VEYPRLRIGGTDRAEVSRQAPDRIAHAHLMDVNAQIAAQVLSGRLQAGLVRRGDGVQLSGPFLIPASLHGLGFHPQGDPTSDPVQPAGQRLAAGCLDGTVRVWDATGGREAEPPGR